MSVYVLNKDLASETTLSHVNDKITFICNTLTNNSSSGQLFTNIPYG